MTAGWQKVFHENPKIGFLAHAAKYQDAAASGKLLAPAKGMDQMRQIVFNDYVDAALATLFMMVVVSILFYGIRACLRAWRSRVPTTREVGGEVGGELSGAVAADRLPRGAGG